MGLWSHATLNVLARLVTFYHLGLDLIQLLSTLLQARAALAAENLYLRKQLALYKERRTVRKYLPEDPKGSRQCTAPSHRWMSFVRNHAKAVLACDFCCCVTVLFRVIYAFIVMEVGTRRLVHFNVTAHPTTAWTLQQFREAVDNEQGYCFLIHDRDRIYSRQLDLAVEAMGVRVLKTPFRSPQANCYCEGLIGSLRRGCLDFLITMNEVHLRRIVRDWQIHYNQARPHV
jgi:putative transposase